MRMKTYFEQIKAGQWHINFSMIDSRSAISYIRDYLNKSRPYTIYCSSSPEEQWTIFDFLNTHMKGNGGNLPIGLGSDILKYAKRMRFIPNGDRPSGKLFMMDASAPILYDKIVKLYPSVDIRIMNTLLEMHRNAAICSALCNDEYVVVCKYPKTIQFTDDLKITKVIWK